MLREDRLQFCRVCVNQAFNADKGIVCSITGAVAAFEGSCTMYTEDEVLKQKYHSTRETKVIANKSLSTNKRLLNYILDMLFIYIFALIVGIVIGVTQVLFSYNIIGTEPDFLTKYAFGFLILFLYYSIWEMLTGRTPGKYITKSKVVGADGKKPSPGRILLRTLCRFIPFEPFSFIGDASEGWHDKISKTQVIDSRKNYFSDYE